ncbi:MAG: peptidase transporter [Firmicutes bacterium]|nr:peptidase transporter [Bacillota bacterium]
MKAFPFYKQYDSQDCGPTCLRMLAKYYGKSYPLSYLRDKCYVSNEGTSLLALSEAAALLGLKSKRVRITYDYLEQDVIFPCIVHWDNNHFVVVYKIDNGLIYVADPAYGKIKLKKETFLAHWGNVGVEEGYALLLEPTQEFYLQQEFSTAKMKLSFMLSYLKPYRQLLTQLLLGMLLGSAIQLILPFLAQIIVDKGIGYNNIGLLQMVLFGQFLLIISRVSVNFIRNWILFYISTPINITLVYDFLVKLFKLPIGFFDAKTIGDILQRIGDHHRVEHFLTSAVLSIFLTIINLIVFSVVLIIYNVKIFLIFLVATAFYFIWIQLFLEKRREIDYFRFKQMSSGQDVLIQLIIGMQEIKLGSCENKTIKKWAKIQGELFSTETKSMALNQSQQAGCTLIQEVQGIIITFFAAYSVIQGDITLGMMLAIQFVLGQLQGPVTELVHLIATAQDAKISFERIEEIRQKQEEEQAEKTKEIVVPQEADIIVSGISFQYGGPYAEKILKDISFVLPNKKITAIVGASGSGKTTLLKLLLGFYPPASGDITIGHTPIAKISCRAWREKCGLVMQDGFIFSDTIADNIALKDETIDEEKLQQSAKIANIDDFITSLPQGYQTKIGLDGHGLSQGQKQRVLIARAIYKNPQYIFFDEATNALDASNESTIMKNLNHFFKGRTVVIVAHRLSTVKNADQIIVLDKGEIVEMGTHHELIVKKGAYFNLVKNQLELGT